jgi:hypothetical protein
MSLSELQSMMWSKIKTSDYDNPPLGYIPENPTYRLWNEKWPPEKDWIQDGLRREDD